MRLATLRMSLSVTMALAIALAATSCKKRLTGDRTTPVDPNLPALRVVAPHVLKKGLTEIHAAFLRAYPGARIDLQVGVVDAMAKKLGAGKGEGDVLLMMDGPEMGIIRKGNLVDESRKQHFTTLETIVAVAKGNPKGIRSLEDLARDDVGTIAYADPAIDSTGLAFVNALRKKGLLAKVKSKAKVTTCPHTACAIAEEKQADVGVTYTPCVLFGHSKMTLCLGAFLPKGEDTATKVVSVPFKDSNHPLLRKYTDFLLSDRAQAVFAKLAFEPVHAPSPAAAQRHLLVPCGAGLRPAMDALGETYFRRTGIRIDYSYAGSGMLLSYLNFSRRGDLYMPGESFYVDLAAERGFVKDTATAAYFLPVIIVQKGNPKHITKLADLTRSGLKVAIGEPKALAVGPVTQRIFQRAGISDRVAANICMKAGCIPELANAVSMRTADAAIVWDAVAYQHTKHTDTISIPAKYNEVAKVLIATLTCSKKADDARAFMEFVASSEGGAIFRRHGFRTEQPEGVRLAPQTPPAKRK